MQNSNRQMLQISEQVNPPLNNALQSPLEITNAIGRAMSKLTPKIQKKI